LLTAAAIAIIAGHETFRGIFSAASGNSTIITENQSCRQSRTLTAGIPDASSALGVLVSNGGYNHAPESYYAKNNLNVKVSREEDQAELIRGFISGRYDIIALSPDSFAALYPSISAIYPVAFLQSGSSAGHTIIASREKASGFSALRKKRVTCVEKSPAHFLILYFLNENKIHPKDINWIFTLTDEDAVRLYSEGKTDFAAYRSSLIRGKIPQSAQILFSTEVAPKFEKLVLIAREADIVERSALYSIFIKGLFEGRKTLQSMKDQDAAALAKKFGAAVDDKTNSAAIIPALNDNFEFFRMTQKRLWDYASAYQSARELYSLPADSTGNSISESLNIVLLDEIDKTCYEFKVMPAAPSAFSSEEFTLFSIDIPFTKDTTEITYPSGLILQEIALKSDLFPYARLSVKGNAIHDEQNAAWLAGARESAVKDAVAKSDPSAAQRLFSSGRKPDEAMSAQLLFISGTPRK
jgi:ABC-type nitrate/sulfonate/bicarbonate transport system substrate-binding protein